MDGKDQAEGIENINLTSNLPASDVPSIIFPCIKDALVWLSCGRNPNLTGELLSPPAFPPPPLLQKATQIQVSSFCTYVKKRKKKKLNKKIKYKINESLIS